MTPRQWLCFFGVFAVAVFVAGISTRAVVGHSGQIEPETPNVVYYMNPEDGSFLPLELARAEMSASANSLTGAVTGQLVVQGQKSAKRIKLGEKVEFVVRPADPSQHFGVRLERFEVKEGKRVLKFVKDPKPNNSAGRPGLLAFETASVGKSSIKISVAYNLPEGEYGITITPHGTGPKVYCFGVDFSN